MDTIEAIEELEKNVVELNSVFTPEQFKKLYDVLSPILLILSDQVRRIDDIVNKQD